MDGSRPDGPFLTGLILAGGASSRMGVDKALLEFDGQPLLRRVARRLHPVCSELLVASGDGERLAGFGYRQIADARPGSGPLGGLVAGLEAAPNDLVAAVAVDMPFASGAMFAFLAERWDGEDAVVPVSDRGPEPLHAVYARSADRPLRRCLEDGTLSVIRSLDSLRVTWVDRTGWEGIEPLGRFASNLNRPEDLPDAIRQREAEP